MKCQPHRWNVEQWLPLYGNPVEETAPEIKCLNCGRVLAVREMTQNMQSSITAGLASRLFRGERYDEVTQSVREYFMFHCTVRPMDDPGKGSLRMREPYKPNPRASVIDEPYKVSLRMRETTHKLDYRSNVVDDSPPRKLPESSLMARLRKRP